MKVMCVNELSTIYGELIIINSFFHYFYIARWSFLFICMCTYLYTYIHGVYEATTCIIFMCYVTVLYNSSN